MDPAEVGLADFGRPEGFLDRQLRRWGKQLDASRNRELAGHRRAARGARPRAAALPRAHGRARRLPARQRADRRRRPDQGRPRLGDVHARRPADRPGPAGDVQRDAGRARLPGVARPPRPPGTRTRPRSIERYAARSGRDVSAVSWYTAFAWFKLAVILEGIHYRYTLGQTVGARLRPHRRAGARLHRARPDHPSGRLIRHGLRIRRAHRGTARASCSPSWTSTSTRPRPSRDEQRARLASPWDTPAVVEELKAEARRQGLWNLFLPGLRVRRRADQPPVRAARRDHRPQPAVGAHGAELRGARHRQHGGARRSSATSSRRSSGWSRCSPARSAPRSR